jgi:four helix bundle protein
MEGAMKKISRFEDLVAWQRARDLTRKVYELTSDSLFARDWALRDQIRRASVSVMSNIAEGFERGGRSEFHQFLVIAKASCAEVRSQLYVALDAGYLSNQRFEETMAKSQELSRIVGGLRVAVAEHRDSKR